MGTTILITGCAGFIGSHLTEALLSEGHNVIGIDNFDPFYAKSIKERNLQAALSHPRFSFYPLDILDTEGLDKISGTPELVIHLAGKAGVRPSISAPDEYVKTNILGTLNILEWMRRRKVERLVFASSSSVYGNSRKVPFEESDDVDSPISPYAFTKRACEMQNHVFHDLHAMSIINLRFFTVYGERQRPDLAIHKFTSRILKGEPIQMYGDGSTYRDYTHVSDIVKGIQGAVDRIRTAEMALFETYNLGNHSPVSLQELITIIERKAGLPAVIERLPMQPGDVDRTYASIEKSSRSLNFKPETSLEEGLERFVKWMKGAMA